MKNAFLDLVTFVVMMVFYIGGFLKNFEVYGLSSVFTIMFGVGSLVLCTIVIIQSIAIMKMLKQ